MANGLNVRDVRLDIRESSDRRGKKNDKIQATVAVENTSEKQTVYASVSLRYVSFDEGNKELTLSTAEPRELSVQITQFMLPTIVPIEPGHTIPIRLQVPLRFVQIMGIQNGRLATEARDISTVRSVKAQIGFGSTAFRPIPKQTAIELRRQLLTWQSVAGNTFERALNGIVNKPSEGDAQ
jgi:hypothetical protein